MLYLYEDVKDVKNTQSSIPHVWAKDAEQKV